MPLPLIDPHYAQDPLYAAAFQRHSQLAFSDSYAPNPTLAQQHEWKPYRYGGSVLREREDGIPPPGTPEPPMTIMTMIGILLHDNHFVGMTGNYKPGFADPARSAKYTLGFGRPNHPIYGPAWDAGVIHINEMIRARGDYDVRFWDQDGNLKLTQPLFIKKGETAKNRATGPWPTPPEFAAPFQVALRDHDICRMVMFDINENSILPAEMPQKLTPGTLVQMSWRMLFYIFKQKEGKEPTRYTVTAEMVSGVVVELARPAAPDLVSLSAPYVPGPRAHRIAASPLRTPGAYATNGHAVPPPPSSNFASREPAAFGSPLGLTLDTYHATPLPPPVQNSTTHHAIGTPRTPSHNFGAARFHEGPPPLNMSTRPQYSASIQPRREGPVAIPFTPPKTPTRNPSRNGSVIIEGNRTLPPTLSGYGNIPFQLPATPPQVSGYYTGAHERASGPPYPFLATRNASLIGLRSPFDHNPAAINELSAFNSNPAFPNSRPLTPLAADSPSPRFTHSGGVARTLLTTPSPHAGHAQQPENQSYAAATPSRQPTPSLPAQIYPQFGSNFNGSQYPPTTHGADETRDPAHLRATNPKIHRQQNHDGGKVLQSGVITVRDVYDINEQLHTPPESRVKENSAGTGYRGPGLPSAAGNAIGPAAPHAWDLMTSRQGVAINDEQNAAMQHDLRGEDVRAGANRPTSPGDIQGQQAMEREIINDGATTDAAFVEAADKHTVMLSDTCAPTPYDPPATPYDNYVHDPNLEADEGNVATRDGGWGLGYRDFHDIYASSHTSSASSDAGSVAITGLQHHLNTWGYSSMSENGDSDVNALDVYKRKREQSKHGKRKAVEDVQHVAKKQKGLFLESSSDEHSATENGGS
ncbi:hypothetical protein B0H11DRAFT_2227551 [Mycena galericulata]|nr:hypothetical protein B0H11DRAFT_2227551 [Mycena galericulata]